MALFFFFTLIERINSVTIKYDANTLVAEVAEVLTTKQRPELDKELYDKKMELLANNPPVVTASSSATSTTVAPKSRPWPVKAPYPLAGALLPFNRIVAYYGNFYSTRMGVLGEYPEAEMLSKLKAEKDAWEKADPSTPVIPAIHYIAATAQGAPGEDGMYRLRMPSSQMDKAVEIAAKADAIVFLDIQIGLSSLQKEIPVLEHYLKMPNVHLGIDPEFSMKTGAKPGTVIGSFDAADINYAIDYLSTLVREHDLPPKILVIHRFTQAMVKNYKDIKPTPEVQVVIDMDGWGIPAQKIGTYQQFVQSEPVQFTGFKLFYKNDLKNPGGRLMYPSELLQLTPRPIYIQYQ